MRGGQRGQALVEFALVSLVLIVLVLGIMDFSFLYFGRVSAYAATRVAARFAATHPTAWTNSPAPDRTTIAGNLTLTAVAAKVPNDDAHLTISYLQTGAGAATLCGRWSAAANAIQYQPGFSSANCVVAGNVIQVQATYTYRFITPLLSGTAGTVSISTVASALEER